MNLMNAMQMYSSWSLSSLLFLQSLLNGLLFIQTLRRSLHSLGPRSPAAASQCPGS